MSRENVEIVRRGLEAFNRGEVEEHLDLLDPNVEWHDPPGMPGAGVHRGREAFLSRWREVEETLEGFTVEPERYFDAGEQVVVFVRPAGRGRMSGVEVSRRIAHVYTVRDGRIAQFVGYEDRAAALEAAGLSRQDVHSDTT
jgi:uncharacterized protein